MVSSSVVHTVGLVNWKNGARLTGRGIGHARSDRPVVWRNRTQPSPTSGSDGQVRIGDRGDRHVADAEADGGRAHVAAARCSRWPTIAPSSTSTHARRWLAKRKRSCVAQLVERGSAG